MSPEERQLLQGLFDRMRNNADTPRDGEAEKMISESVGKQPYAPYLLAQTVIVQDQALQAANERLMQLEQQLQEQQAPPQQQGGGGFLSGLFGGGASSQPHYPPPQPSTQRPTWNQGTTGYPPQGGYPQQQGYAPQQGGMSGGPWGGMQQPAGGGFLQGALGTAAGVAGGVLAADAIGSLFRSGHAGGSLGIGSGVPGFGGAPAGGTNVTNNYYGDGSTPGGANSTADAQQDKDYDFDNKSADAHDGNQAQDNSQDLADYDVGDSDGFA